MTSPNPNSNPNLENEKEHIGWDVWKAASKAAKGLLIWAAQGTYSVITRTNDDGTTAEQARPDITITDTRKSAILNIPAKATINNAATEGTVVCLLLPLTNPNKVLFYPTNQERYYTLNAADINPGKPIIMS